MLFNKPHSLTGCPSESFIKRISSVSSCILRTTCSIHRNLVELIFESEIIKCRFKKTVKLDLMFYVFTSLSVGYDSVVNKLFITVKDISSYILWLFNSDFCFQFSALESLTTMTLTLQTKYTEENIMHLSPYIDLPIYLFISTCWKQEGASSISPNN